MDHSNRARLIDVPERRTLAMPPELRKDPGTGQLVMSGYAATWDPYDCYGGPDHGGWVEKLERAAFERTLDEKPDMMLLVNHEGLPLARTKSGTLQLDTDRRGLTMRAMLDPDDPDVQRLIPKMKRKDLNEMSFSFRVKDQAWNSDYSHRTITELSLQKGDVSIVNYGMNPNTHAIMGVESLARADGSALMEVRRLDRTVLAGAMANLRRAWRANEEPEHCPGGADCMGAMCPDHGEKAGKRQSTLVNFDGGHLLHGGECLTCAGARAKTPSQYGNVDYADPGYLDSSGKQAKGGNGVKRYPIDKTHVKAAWSYINMPKNQKGYTPSQLASIKNKIKAAMKKFGHDTDDSDSKSLQTVVDIDRVEGVRTATGGLALVAVMTDGSRTPLPSLQDTSSPISGVPRMRKTDNSVTGSGKVSGTRVPVKDEGEDDPDEFGEPIKASMQNWKDDEGPNDPHNEPYKAPGRTGPGQATDNSVLDAKPKTKDTDFYDIWPEYSPNDPHDDPYDAPSDEGDKDPDELHGDPAPEPSPAVGTAFRQGTGPRLGGHDIPTTDHPYSDDIGTEPSGDAYGPQKEMDDEAVEDEHHAKTTSTSKEWMEGSAAEDPWGKRELPEDNPDFDDPVKIHATARREGKKPPTDPDDPEYENERQDGESEAAPDFGGGEDGESDSDMSDDMDDATTGDGGDGGGLGEMYSYQPSVTEHLQRLRRNAELPDLPTLAEAAAYLHQLG